MRSNTKNRVLDTAGFSGAAGSAAPLPSPLEPCGDGREKTGSDLCHAMSMIRIMIILWIRVLQITINTLVMEHKRGNNIQCTTDNKIQLFGYNQYKSEMSVEFGNFILQNPLCTI